MLCFRYRNYICLRWSTVNQAIFSLFLYHIALKHSPSKRKGQTSRNRPTSISETQETTDLNAKLSDNENSELQDVGKPTSWNDSVHLSVSKYSSSSFRLSKYFTLLFLPSRKAGLPPSDDYNLCTFWSRFWQKDFYVPRYGTALNYSHQIKKLSSRLSSYQWCWNTSPCLPFICIICFPWYTYIYRKYIFLCKY